MQRAFIPRALRRYLIACLCLFFTSALWGAESGTEAKATNEVPADSQQTLRVYLQLQEQLHSAILAIEQNRQESTAAVQRNAELVSARLKLVEQALSMQRDRESETMQKSNRTLLIVAGLFGAVGLLAMVITAVFVARTMNRLAEISTALPKALALGPQPSAGALLGHGESSVIALPAESTRLLGAIERLEKRIHELEGGSATPQLLSMSKEHANGNGHSNGNGNGRHDTLLVSSPAGDESQEGEPKEKVSVILGKGQTLLNLGQCENALACFEEVLAVSPDHAEALVKKGTALERLRRWEEALQCYDQAIAANKELTLAYLYKGGVYNQLERFSEALACYEQALRTQQKSTVAA